MSVQHMLTTTDNPYDPSLDFDRWYQYDREKGYHTCEYLARIAGTSSELDEEYNTQLIEAAIDDICKHNVLGIATDGAVAYKRVAVRAR